MTHKLETIDRKNDGGGLNGLVSFNDCKWAGPIPQPSANPEKTVEEKDE